MIHYYVRFDDRYDDVEQLKLSKSVDVDVYLFCAAKFLAVRSVNESFSPIYGTQFGS